MTLETGARFLSPRRLSRRAAIQMLGGGAAVAVLSACGNGATSQVTPSAATQAATATGTATASPTAIASRSAATSQAANVMTSGTATAASSGGAPPTSAAVASGTSTTAPVAIAIPNTGATLPTGPVTYRVTVHPNLGETVQGIYSGQLTDAKKALQALQSASDQELDRAIKAAQTKGAKVTRDDWVFPNWDSTKDYTVADYQALSG